MAAGNYCILDAMLLGLVGAGNHLHQGRIAYVGNILFYQSRVFMLVGIGVQHIGLEPIEVPLGIFQNIFHRGKLGQSLWI